ncbi:MAG: FprA family A-type flavoprotein [Thermofilum sp.]
MSSVEPRTFVEKVTPDLFLLRVDDTRIKFFEGMWEIPEGITYNAYLLATGEGAVLFDGWKREYAELLLSSLESIVDIRSVKFAVVHHAEPDHSGSAPVLAEKAPHAVFLGHPIAGRILKSHYRVERFRPVKDGEALQLGGRTLRFIYAPWLHWPDTIFTFVEEEGVLLSCDVFGSYSTPSLFDDEADLEALARAVRKYAVTVVGHYSEWIAKGLEKLKTAGINPKIIAPAHGTVYRSNPHWAIERWAEISSGAAKRGKTALVYVSMYGNVDRLFHALEERLRGRGLEVAVHAFTDKQRSLASEVLTDVSDAELLILGVPVYEASVHPLMIHLARLIGEKLPSRKQIPILLLSSYGWGPASRKLAEILQSYGFTNLHIIDFEGSAGAELLAKVDSLLSEAHAKLAGGGA